MSARDQSAYAFESIVERTVERTGPPGPQEGPP